MKTIKALTALSAAFFSASTLAHTGLELAPGTLITGLMHPLTGLDHVLALLLLGGIISLLFTGQQRPLKPAIAGALTLGILLSWSFLHYAGNDFSSYALGFASSSAGLMTIGGCIAGFSQRLESAHTQDRQ